MTKKIKIKHGWNKLRFYLSFLLLTFYLIVGGIFLYTNVWIDFFPKGRAIIGGILILFGALRFYVAYRRYANKHSKIKALKKIGAEENVAVE